MNDLLLWAAIPTEWSNLLEVTRKYYPTAIIAGGSLRDLDYEVLPKDLDIFISCPINSKFNLMYDMPIEGAKTIFKLEINSVDPIPEHYLESDLENLDLEHAYQLDYVRDHYRNNRTKRKLAESKIRNLKKQKRKIYCVKRALLGKTNVDFIFGCKNTCDINQFDLSFCQISFDGEDIIKTEAYERTKNTNIVKITNKNTFKQSRVDKFKQKFPDLIFEEYSA